MTPRHEKTMAGRIFDNILFLEEVFGDKADADIPDVPMLELAKCFDLSPPRTLGVKTDTKKRTGRLRSREIAQAIAESSK